MGGSGDDSVVRRGVQQTRMTSANDYGVTAVACCSGGGGGGGSVRWCWRKEEEEKQVVVQV